jgi:hypothetical protein
MSLKKKDLTTKATKMHKGKQKPFVLICDLCCEKSLKKTGISFEQALAELAKNPPEEG